MKKIRTVLPLIVAAAWWTQADVHAEPIGTAFIYQGQLKQGGVPLNGSADFEFTLWDTEIGGDQIGSLVAKDVVQVKDGLFQVKLDFGANALGGARWLAISVRSPAGVGSFEPVLPRQQIASSPYSIQTRGVFVDDDGRVGIGTSTPEAKLDVVAPSGRDLREPIIRLGVDDAVGDFFLLANSTRYDEQFLPLLWGHHQSDERNALQIIATTDADHDVGGDALMVFDTFLSDGLSLTDPIANRRLFQWSNDNQPLMTMTAAGRVGVGTASPSTSLHLGLASNASDGIFLGKQETNLGTRLSVRGTNNQIFGIDIDPNGASGYEQFEITYNGGSPVFVIDRYGDVGIGAPSPETPLHVAGGSDVSPSGGGHILVGSIAGSNIAIDNNEIMARSNGSTSTLFLNNNGGDVVVGGDLDIGLEFVEVTSSSGLIEVFCPTGKRVIAGGCNGGLDEIEKSIPNDDRTGWICDFNGGNSTAFAICARVK